MGLIHPVDLDAWRAWQRHQNRLRELRHRNADDSVALDLLLGGVTPRLLFAIDTLTVSSTAALGAALDVLNPDTVAVIVPRGLDLPGVHLQREPVETPIEHIDALAEVHAVATLGHFLPAGATATALAQHRHLPVFVVQHGLLTPHAPPLPTECTLLAWSEADGEFWRSGRDDVTVDVVGSQLLWQAAQRPRVEVDPGADPIFLGQLHGAEISRHEMARISTGFCRATGAHYRPHPSEVDKLSRAQHALMRRRGVRFADTATPLDEIATPIVGVFSTGILEAAAHQVPAWAYHPAPPAWIEDLWERYGLNPWGLDPTPPPALPEFEPARRIAAILNGS